MQKFVSKRPVGATENLIIAASLAEGETILNNCATEPEIADLVKFLVKMGCNINWISERSLKIKGVSKINEIVYKVILIELKLALI